MSKLNSIMRRVNQASVLEQSCFEISSRQKMCINNRGVLCTELKVRVACGGGQNKAKSEEEEEELILIFHIFQFYCQYIVRQMDVEENKQKRQLRGTVSISETKYESFIEHSMLMFLLP